MTPKSPLHSVIIFGIERFILFIKYRKLEMYFEKVTVRTEQ